MTSTASVETRWLLRLVVGLGIIAARVGLVRRHVDIPPRRLAGLCASTLSNSRRHVVCAALAIWVLIGTGCEGSDQGTGDVMAISLRRASRLSLAGNTALDGGSWDSSGNLVVWSERGQAVWLIDASGAVRDIPIPGAGRPLIAQLYSDGTIAVVENGFGRMTVLDSLQRVVEEGFLWEAQADGLSQLVSGPRGTWYGVSDSAGGRVTIERIVHPTSRDTLVEIDLPTIHRQYQKEGAVPAILLSSAQSDHIAMATRWPPFHVLLVGSSECPEQVWHRLKYTAGTSKRSRWVATALHPLGEEWLLIASDLRSNRRLMVRFSACGRVISSTAIDQPFGVVTVNPDGKALIGVTRDSGFAYYRYDIHSRVALRK